MKLINWVAAALVACWLLPTSAQTPAVDSSEIDAATLTRANTGDVAAQIYVGDCYADGRGVARSYRLAAEWYTKAADKGDVTAEMKLAALYRDGSKDLPRNMSRAAEWYRKAAEQGEVTAQGTLGTLYFMGQGVARDYLEAYFWLDLAASVSGPKQSQYAANRQMVGIQITADELESAKERVAAWKASHPRKE
jgi:FOG: TPR repeat, SEL1 subfamily